MTTAIVMSGGGIRGPLEVGALESLFEHGIKPDFLVGTSAGAINAGFTAAAGPTLASIPMLKAAWRTGSKDAVYAGDALTIAMRVLTNQDSLFPSDGLRNLIAGNLPAGVTTFGQLKCPCYLTAVDLRSRRLYLFGEDPACLLVDAMVASSSIPAVHPPVDYHGLQLVDGGVVAAAPAGVAMDRGATVIYSVNVGGGEESGAPVHGILPILTRTIDTFISQTLFEDLARAAQDPRVELHHIHIAAFSGLAFNDFSHVEEMYVEGKRSTDEYLANPQPRLVAPARAVQPPAPWTVPGARQYVPPAWR